jgi:hypothetical protein
MTKPNDLRIAINKNLYGACSSMVAYINDIEVGRASRFHENGKLAWTIGPTGFDGCDDFDLNISFNPEKFTNEAMLERVETLLRFSLSAAEAFRKEAA